MYRPGGRIPVGKGGSGKECAYMAFLKLEGYARFQAQTGEKYTEKNPDHKRLVSQWYAGVSKEERAEMVERCSRQFPQTQRSKAELQRMRRRIRSQQAGAVRQADVANRDRLRQRYVRQLDVADTAGIHNVHTTEYLDNYCARNKRTYSDRISSELRISRDVDRHPLENTDYVFVSISPRIYVYKYNIDKVSMWPAEISITVFNLRDGIKSSGSCFISFNKEWMFLGEEPNDVDLGNISAYEDILGIPSTRNTEYDRNILTPHDAYDWFKTKLDQNMGQFILVDKHQLAFVYNGLAAMATFTGVRAVSHFTSIGNNFLPIQDFADILLTEGNLAIPQDQKWTASQIDAEIKYHKLFPLADKNTFCDFHETVEGYRRYHCVKAHTARTLHNFFFVLKENRLQFIHEYCQRSSHQLCTEDNQDTTLPESLVAPVIDASLATGQERRNDDAPGTSENIEEDSSDEDNGQYMAPVAEGQLPERADLNQMQNQIDEDSESDSDVEYVHAHAHVNGGVTHFGQGHSSVQRNYVPSGPMAQLSSSRFHQTQPFARARDIAAEPEVEAPQSVPRPAPQPATIREESPPRERETTFIPEPEEEDPGYAIEPKEEDYSIPAYRMCSTEISAYHNYMINRPKKTLERLDLSAIGKNHQ